MHYISGCDADQLPVSLATDNPELSGLSMTALKKIICSAGLSVEGCVEKRDLVARASLIHGKAADPARPNGNAKENNDAEDVLGSVMMSFIEERAAAKSPDMLAVLYLAELGHSKWARVGAERGNAAVAAVYGWHLLCMGCDIDALAALTYLKLAKDMKVARGLNLWGLIMECTYGEVCAEEARTCYLESAHLGSVEGMYNTAHTLASRGDYAEAMVWWKNAAEQGHSPSMFEVYKSDRQGSGCKGDATRGCKLLQQAAACLRDSE